MVDKLVLTDAQWKQRLTVAPALKPLDHSQPVRLETATFATG